MNFKFFPNVVFTICFYQNQTSTILFAILKCLCIFLPKYLSKTKLWIWWKLNVVYMIFFPHQTSDHFMRRERDSCGHSKWWKHDLTRNVLSIICLPHKNLSRRPEQWYLFFWSVLINTRYLPSLHILERVQTYKEIIISIISSFSFTPKASTSQPVHYLAPTDILSIFFSLSSLLTKR